MIKKNILHILNLIKYKLISGIVLSAILGYFIDVHRITNNFFFLIFGIFFLAAAASILNNIQDKDIDALRKRTKNRPLITKVISVKKASLIFIIAVILGTIFLSLINLQALLLGILALILYNFVYTPLKRRSILSIFLGAFIGSIVPFIGWIATEPILFNYQIIYVCSLYYFWQIAHSLILLLIYDEENDHANLPKISKYFSADANNKIIFLWQIAIITLSLLIPLFNLVESELIKLSLLGIYLLFILTPLLVYFKFFNKFDNKYLYYNINLYIFIISLIIICDKLIIKV